MRLSVPTAIPTVAELTAVMQQMGWRAVSCRRLMLGPVAVHVDVREQGSERTGELAFSTSLGLDRETVGYTR